MAGKRHTVEIPDDDLQELIACFDTLDAAGKKDGKISISELETAFDVVGVKVPGYKLRRYLEKYDTSKDNMIDLEEFKIMYSEFKKDEDVSHTFKKAVSARKGVQTLGGSSEASSEGTTHSVKEEEQKAFAEWIYGKLKDDEEMKGKLPEDDNKLYECCKDGILLCKLINHSVPDTIDERAINKKNLNKFTKNENQMLALNSAQAIGCNIVNIGPTDLMEGKPYLVLGLLWQVIRIGLLSEVNLQAHPGLVCLLEEGEELSDLMKLSPEQILLRWVNYHLAKAGINRQIRNFSEDIKDSEAYTHLLHQIAPDDAGVGLAPLGESDSYQRAESMLMEAEKIKCRAFITSKDVVKGNAKLNLAFVANLFNNYPALDKQDVELDIVEETREEKTYRNWMNSLGVKPFVHYLYEDLKDGLVIFRLYDYIQPGVVDWKRVKEKFHKMRVNFEKIENCNYAVELGKQCKFSLVGIGGQDINEGNQTLTLALVWQLMRAYTLSVLNRLAKASGGSGNIVDQDIIKWANEMLKDGAKGQSFRSFKDSELSDARIIIDLIDCIKPKSINYDLVKDSQNEEDRLSNAKYAISMARKIGARVYALPEDIVEVKPKMMMTIFACLMIRDYDHRPSSQQQEEQ